ncbi:hypothetical protein P153DRAFT_295060 [Dothidotthia symphoricarpi CBS 119687]|uniref:CFEM domain-containing protein n=1 Tax=Dothidotthia symphoricarpi CBS 119687 TaxID=1392245 RepID=A0A6A6A7L1_9PLEO|nr:uncharacterized protein P153DRAFT_295060 [Dothidotthia symphoricarpi CBS 119687]KAF2127849.1 hypothetical protein P153DRAFT_295060 [Dothidotthia symphoricarpi CBS 119687]
MRLSAIAVAFSAATLASAQLTYNLTQALQPGNFAKYHCLDNDKLMALMPPVTAQCLAECQLAANKGDGCAENDFACHCVNYYAYSSLIEPCAFALPANPETNPPCDQNALFAARPIIQDLCNFFNATLYADYRRCPQELSRKMTYEIVANEEVDCGDE